MIHVKVSKQERVRPLINMHMPEQYAKFVTFLETLSAKGAEDMMNDVVEKVTGQPPQKFDAFLKDNKAVWS